MTQSFVNLCERVLGAAEKALKRNGSVGPIYGSTGILGECKKSTVFRRGLRFIPKGCETVAGGRSAAETTGKLGTTPCISKRCQNPSIRQGKQFIASGIPQGCDLPFAPIRWSPLRCDHRLLSAIPSGMNRKGCMTLGEFIPQRFPMNPFYLPPASPTDSNLASALAIASSDAAFGSVIVRR